MEDRKCEKCVYDTRHGCCAWECKFIDRNEAIKALENQKHGYWTERYVADAPVFFRKRWYCSNCGDWNTYGMPDYCPDCGAKMDEVK